MAEDPSAFQRTLDEYGRILVQSGAMRVAADLRGRFRLRNGAYSWVYLDHGDLLCQPETNSVLTKVLVSYIRAKFDPQHTVLANVDSKSSPQLTGAIASIGSYRQVVVLPEVTYRRERGMRLRLRLPAQLTERDSIVIVDDVLTPSDTTGLQVAKLVRRHVAERVGGKPRSVEVHLVVGVARDPSIACPPLQRNGIRVHWLKTLDEIISGAWPDLPVSQRERLRREFPAAPDGGI
jgi:orotate phosphoribosyltransferase